MEEKSEAAEVGGDGGGDVAAEEQSLSKSALKKQQKLLLLKKRKAERKAAEKEKRKQELEGKRREWDEKLAAATEEERARLVESRREARKERMAQRNEEREMKTARLRSAALSGHKLVLDLDFGHLMSPNEIRSLVHQIMYCYSVNGKSATPAHLWLTGFAGEIENKLKKLPDGRCRGGASRTRSEQDLYHRRSGGSKPVEGDNSQEGPRTGHTVCKASHWGVSQDVQLQGSYREPSRRDLAQVLGDERLEDVLLPGDSSEENMRGKRRG